MVRRAIGETYDGFAELDTGGVLVMLSLAGQHPDALAGQLTADPAGRGRAVVMPVVAGVVLHHTVDDAGEAAERARDAGGLIIHGRIDMDMGTRSAIARGPGGLLIDLCKQIRTSG